MKNLYKFINLKKIDNFIFNSKNIFNTFQIINLQKHKTYPENNKNINLNNSTKIIVNSGKIILNLSKIHKTSNIIKTNTSSTLINNTLITNTLFLENDKIITTKFGCDIEITKNRYILVIPPKINFNIYSYENSIFQLFY